MAVPDWDKIRNLRSQIKKAQSDYETRAKRKYQNAVTAQASISFPKDKNQYFVSNDKSKLQVSKGLYDKIIESNKQQEFLAAQEQARQNLIPPTTSKQRANAAVNQVQLRAATAPASALIPLKQNISVSVTPSTRQQPKQEEISSGFAGRIENMLQREKRVENLKQAYYRQWGIDYQDSDTYWQRFGKAARQTPWEIASMPAIIGGRAAFAAEALFSKPGRAELWSAAKKTPGAVVQSFNPTRPEGLLNIGIAAFGAYSLGKSFSIAKQNKGFISNQAGVERTTSPQNVFDRTMLDIKARLGAKGQKAIDIKGLGSQEYIKYSDTQFGVKGAAELLTNGKRTAVIEMRGTATKVQGGYDVFTISKVTNQAGKTNYIVDLTQSADLLYEPFVSFKTLSRSTTVGAKQSVYKGRASQISAGSTGEIYIEDIFTGKNIFRTNTVTESGQLIGTKTYLGSTNFGLKAGTFEQEFVTIRNAQPKVNPFANTESPINLGDLATMNKKGSLTLTSVKTLQGETLPTTTAKILTQVGRTQAVQSLRAARGQQAIATGSMSGVVLGISQTKSIGRTDYMLSPQAMPETKLKLGNYLLPSIRLATELKPISLPSEEAKTIPRTMSVQRMSLQPRLIPELQPALQPELMPELKPALSPSLKPQFNPDFTPDINIPIVPLLPAGIPFIEFDGRRKKGKRVPFKPKYFASVEAAALGIRGRPTRMSVISGLQIRPIRRR